MTDRLVATGKAYITGAGDALEATAAGRSRPVSVLWYLMRQTSNPIVRDAIFEEIRQRTTATTLGELLVASGAVS